MPIIPSFDGIKANLERGLGRPMEQGGRDAGRRFGDSAGRSMTAAIGRHAKKAALITSGALVGAGYLGFKFGQDAIDLAADLEQSVGAIDTVFGKSARRMHRWAKGAADDVGLSRNEFNELGTVIGAQLKNGGTAMDRLAPKTNKLIKLGADLSSMFGGTTTEAVEALSSALKGERDPIERYGVSLNQAKIDAEAASLGFEKVDGALSSQAQQAATLSLIFKQTSDAQGNFARESDTLAGKQQRLKARLEDTKTEIGTALLPIISDAADFLLEEGVPAFEKFADWFGEKGAPAIASFVDDMKPVANEVLPAVAGAIEDIGGFLKDAAPLAADLVGAFNDMPEWAKQGLILGGVGLGVGAKIKGKAGGLLGSGSGSSITNPAYVVVVNGGGGLAGGPGGKGKGPKGFPIAPAGLLPALVGGGIVLENGPKILSGLQTTSSDSARIDDIRKALEASDLGRIADDLGIDLDRLAEGLARDGKNSVEFAQAVKKLERTNDGAWEHINDLIPVVGSWITTSGDNAAFALKDLKGIVEGLGTHLRPLLSGEGTPDSIDLTDVFGKIPDNKLKLLQDPETIKTRQDVRVLLGDVDGLTRRDFKLIFQALGLSKAVSEAKTLKRLMEDLTGMSVPSASSSYPDGFIGPRPSRLSSFPDPSSPFAGRVNVYTDDPRRVLGAINDATRRASIGGFG